MASYTAVRVKSQTLTAATVDTVTLSATGAAYVEVYNRSTGTDVISFTTDGTTPTALGDDCYVVGGGQALAVPASTTATKLISAGTPGYTVTAVPDGNMVPSVNGYVVR